MPMQTAVVIAVSAGVITSVIMVVLSQFVTPEGAPEALGEDM